MPVSTPLVRLYSEYMHAEYGELDSDLDSDYVFVNLWGGQARDPDVISDCRQARGADQGPTGVEFTVHMLRHMHATDMVRRGVPIEVVAKLLTHRSSTTTSQTYVLLKAAVIRDALNRVGVWNDEAAR